MDRVQLEASQGCLQVLIRTHEESSDQVLLFQMQHKLQQSEERCTRIEDRESICKQSLGLPLPTARYGILLQQLKLQSSRLSLTNTNLHHKRRPCESSTGNNTIAMKPFRNLEAVKHATAQLVLGEHSTQLLSQDSWKNGGSSRHASKDGLLAANIEKSTESPQVRGRERVPLLFLNYSK